MLSEMNTLRMRLFPSWSFRPSSFNASKCLLFKDIKDGSELDKKLKTPVN